MIVGQSLAWVIGLWPAQTWKRSAIKMGADVKDIDYDLLSSYFVQGI